MIPTTSYTNASLLCILRWIAIIGQSVTILTVHYGMGITLPIVNMFVMVGVLIALNLFSLYRLHSGKMHSERDIALQLTLDVLVLAGQLYLSGGATNPFISLFLIQVVIAAALLPRRYIWGLVALTILCYITLTFYYTPIPHMHHHMGGTTGFFNMHLHGMLIGFILSVVLIAYFVVKMAHNIQELRDKARVEEHVMKLGLLSAGAAHALGTPLSTIAVIAHELERDPTSHEHINMLVTQVKRCKHVVSDILAASGHMRAEEAHTMPLKHYLYDMTTAWATGHASVQVQCQYNGNHNPTVLAEKILQQAITNILDNALEAHASSILVDTHCSDDELILTITDNGQGIQDTIRDQLGTAYISTKTEGSHGLGLFLSRAVIQHFGGHFTITPLPHGTRVTMTLPLAAISVEA